MFVHIECGVHLRLRNGAEVITDGKHIKITELPDGTSTLVIDACDQIQDALTYKAVASNEAGEADTSALLTITSTVKGDQPEERPSFLKGLKDIITDEGEPLILEASFTANPIPSVEWTKEGVLLPPSERILHTCDGRKVRCFNSKQKVMTTLLLLLCKIFVCSFCA